MTNVICVKWFSLTFGQMDNPSVYITHNKKLDMMNELYLYVYSFSCDLKLDMVNGLSRNLKPDAQLCPCVLRLSPVHCLPVAGASSMFDNNYSLGESWIQNNQKMFPSLSVTTNYVIAV